LKLKDWAVDWARIGAWAICHLAQTGAI